jgi:UDP-N-acetylmuramate dehydrogenase
MQPLADTSAGCAFKNPVDENGQRISAGKLIDQSGLKGTSKGGASVSQQHANFITTSKGATAQDVIAVMNTIEKKVFDYTGITLQREVVVWSRCEVSTT